MTCVSTVLVLHLATVVSSDILCTVPSLCRSGEVSSSYSTIASSNILVVPFFKYYSRCSFYSSSLVFKDLKTFSESSTVVFVQEDFLFCTLKLFKSFDESDAVD